MYAFEGIDGGDVFFWGWRREGPVWADGPLSAGHIGFVGYGRGAAGVGHGGDTAEEDKLR